MTLQKNDLEKIGKVVKEEVGEVRRDLKSTESRLNKRITGLDEKVSGLDVKFTGLDEKVSGLDVKFTGLDERVSGLGKDLKSTESRLGKRIAGLDVKFTGLDKKIEEEIGSLAMITAKGFNEVYRRFDKNDREHKEIKDSINNLEFIATEMVRRGEFLELKRRLEKIETKVGKL